jgi:predicted ABC-class ATPase
MTPTLETKRGRVIEGAWAIDILTKKIPYLIARSFVASSLDLDHVRQHVLSVEDQQALRDMLPTQGSLAGRTTHEALTQVPTLGLVAFVINGAILPRATGNSDVPMKGAEVVRFVSPPSMETRFTLPNRGPVIGMGIPAGVTLIVGGGYHGKSTLLQALQVGVYNHVPGDGREFVCVDPTAVKVSARGWPAQTPCGRAHDFFLFCYSNQIRAEDGRSVRSVNITPFIRNLPFNKDTSNFSTADASGSTSQAAAVVEAVEVSERWSVCPPVTARRASILVARVGVCCCSSTRTRVRPIS